MLIGSALHAQLARGLVRTAESLDDLRRALEFSRRATKWNPAAALALLASGIYLGSIGWWTLAWFHVAVAAWIANLVLAVTVIIRTESAMARMAGATGDGPLTPALDALRRGRAWRLAHAAMLANDLAMVYVMYTKPELSGSLLVVLAAQAGAIDRDGDGPGPSRRGFDSVSRARGRSCDAPSSAVLRIRPHGRRVRRPELPDLA